MTSKKILRETIRQRKRQYSTQELSDMSLAVVERLKANSQFSHARTLFIYSSLSDEVDTTTLLDSLALCGKTVVLPKVVDAENMELRLYTGREDLAVGSYSIMEPTGKLFTALHDIDVAVVPGMAFDRNGHRLGRGKGYYDRILAQMPQAYKIGICFDFQLMENIPHDAHDVSMDEVIY
ncbi:MAG: 5-formyltetrahydrofolate cyclo-ligase [Prevotella sp.]|nr:5-formyltetrahydrofolate cyclo-ligase [Prevotella sp.]